MKRAFAALLLAVGCAAPGTDIDFQPGDFALIEIQLQG